MALLQASLSKNFELNCHSTFCLYLTDFPPLILLLAVDYLVSITHYFMHTLEHKRKKAKLVNNPLFWNKKNVTFKYPYSSL